MKVLPALAFLAALALAHPAAIAAEKSSADEAPPVVRFIDLPPMSAAILRSNRVRGLVTVQITLEVLKPEEAAEVQGKLPRVQATLLNALQRHVGRLRSSSDLLDLEEMLNEMQRNADIVAGNGTVRPLLQNVQYGR